MGQINTREIVLLGTTTVTTSGTGPDINLIQGWQAATVMVNSSAASGTLPTLNVYVQMKLGQAATTDLAGAAPTGTAIYDDVLHFSQITTTPVRLMNVTTGQETFTINSSTYAADWANANQTIAAGAIRFFAIGGLWRVAYVIGGTTPSFTLAVSTQLIPYAT